MADHKQSQAGVGSLSPQDSVSTSSTTRANFSTLDAQAGASATTATCVGHDSASTGARVGDCKTHVSTACPLPVHADGSEKGGGKKQPDGALLAKVCGITRPEDAALCHELGFDFIGLIFATGSGRRVTVDEARRIPSGNAHRVGVFTDNDAGAILRTVQDASLDLVQLHGRQDETVTARLADALGPDRLIRVFWPEQEGRLNLEAAMARYAPLCGLFLLDAGKGGGGHGRSLDWSLLAGLRTPRPWLLAGGLYPETAARAIAACSPGGLDFNSGLEDGPGIKNHDAIRRAAAVLRSCGNGSSQKDSSV